MIERDSKRDIAIVLGVRDRTSSTSDAYKLEEAIGLTAALGADIIYSESVAVRQVNVANYFGGGKIDEIKSQITLNDANIVIVNTALSPIQQRNLERSWKAKVIDRTGLILEIFGLRAATKEGRIQVEMARLTYERSRLVRTWTHLERQRGGQGFLAGPGETQIESDRRVLNDKIAKLRRELDAIRKRRHLQRKARQRAPERIVALVGYTNAGKSTLFNILTQADVFAQDMLFATLDTTHRILPLPNGKPAVLSDTVGFIADLPTDLITAFRATLEEVKEADVLLHVRDMSDPLSEDHKQNVLDVLDMIEAGPEHDQVTIEVWNKIDLLNSTDREILFESAKTLSSEDDIETVFPISCMNQDGIETLREGIEAALSVKDDIVSVSISPKDYGIRAWLHQNGQVLAEETEDNGLCHMQVQLSDADAGKFRSRYPQVLSANS